jgi:hypothetical protein
MLSVLPALPSRWIYGEKVPFAESNTVEFKEVAIFSGLFTNKSSQSSGLPKYRDTLIGFLNGGCGYLIMGVRNDGTITGVGDMSDITLDKFKLWIDSTFNVIMYKDGSPIDPSQTTLKVSTFPVEGALNASHIVCVEAIHKGESLDIMTRAGKIIYRLNASNYRIASEPMYRKRDVQGMICSIQSQMQSVINDKHKALKILQEKHKDEIEALLKGEKERSEQHVRTIMTQVSESLYSKYHLDPTEPALKESMCRRFMKILLGQ